MSFASSPIRANGDKVTAAWFNALRTAGIELENMSGAGAGISPGLTFNIAPKYDSGTGTMKLVTADGDDFDADNLGVVPIFDTDTGLTKMLTLDDSTDHFFIDDVGSSDIIGMRWGTTNAIAWGNPLIFSIYIADTSVGPRTFCSPNNRLSNTPAAASGHGYHGNPSTAHTYSDIFWWNASNLTTETSVPCVKIGTFRMTKAVTTNDWTVIQIDIDEGDGIRLGQTGSGVLTYPQNQNGAEAGSHLDVSAGTLPSWDNEIYTWALRNDGWVEVDFRFSSNAVNGTSSNPINLTLPLPVHASVASSYVNIGIVDSTGLTVDFQVLSGLLTAGSAIVTLFAADGSNITQDGFGAAGDQMRGRFAYRAF